MGSFHQWFDRDKLKEIFRTHWESFKEKFSRYRAARYDEVVKKIAVPAGSPESHQRGSRDGQEIKRINHRR